MKRLMMSLLVLGASVAALVSGSFAVFQDTETSLDNTFTAGTVDFRYRICIDVVRDTTCGPWQDGTHASFTLPKIRHGAAGRVIYQIQNLGDLEGFFDLRNVTVTNFENGCSARERAVDTTCGNPGSGEDDDEGDDEGEDEDDDEDEDHLGVTGEGELGAHLGVTVVAPRYGTIYTGPLNGLHGDYDINERLAPAGSPLDTLDLMFNWHLPASAGIVIDGDSASLDMEFVLNQDP
ncbi:MAG: SipW-dependent-type signal peptide-containing protein [Chloroflexota bacterium]|nr:SipW-dependent-type signal peptide-containing protein [Chloroflexota bacterium]